MITRTNIILSIVAVVLLAGAGAGAVDASEAVQAVPDAPVATANLAMIDPDPIWLTGPRASVYAATRPSIDVAVDRLAVSDPVPATTAASTARSTRGPRAADERARSELGRDAFDVELSALQFRARVTPHEWESIRQALAAATRRDDPTGLPSRTEVGSSLHVAPVAPSQSPMSVSAPAPASAIGEGRWIDVNLTHQTLTAYEGQSPVRSVAVSTGLPGTPTPIGQFRIWVKFRYDDMEGPGYYLPDVPYTMYFHGGYGLHGTYWHSNFGHPMSHGCVNLPTPEAEWLFHWAEVGTLVNVHD